jgi:hypothetical protein
LVPAPAAAAAVFPNPLSFGNQPLGLAVTTGVVVSNRGSLQTSMSTVTISGPNAADFSQTNNCAGALLAPGGGSCVNNITFTPSMAAAESAVLTINDSVGTQTVDITGTGIEPPGFSPSVTTIAFGNQLKGVTSPQMGVAITNSGSSVLMIGGVTVVGANAGDFAIESQSCTTAGIDVNNTCGVYVAFTPSIYGSETASLKFVDNIAGSPQFVALTGAGADFSIGVGSGGSTTASVTAGSTATYALQLSPLGGFAGNVSLSCTGAPLNAVCSSTPTTVSLNGSSASPFSVQVTTTGSATVLPFTSPERPDFDRLRTLLLEGTMGCALALLIFGARFRGATSKQRQRHAWPAAVAVAMIAIGFASCGGGSGGSTPPPTKSTPAGTYTLTLTATSGSASHTTILTLIVSSSQ